MVVVAPPKFMELTAAGSQVTVTVTATALSALITTADATMTDFTGVDYILLNPEGVIRYLYKSIPTAAVGIECIDLQQLVITGINPTNLMLIAAGNVLVNVQLGRLT